MPSRRICPKCRRYRWIPLGHATCQTSSCRKVAAMAESPWVHCETCDQPWRAADPGVQHRTDPAPGWQCADLFACRRRAKARNAEVAAMYRALDDVWDQLAKDGWRWPDAP